MIDIQAIVREIRAADPRRVTVVYHDNCSDGFTAAWAAATALGRQVQLVPAQHQLFNPDTLTGDHLVVADFSFDLATLIGLQRRFKHVLVLDHHKTHAKDLIEFGSAVYDVNRSGAGIVWDTLVGAARPKLIDYVEDRDLWSHKLEHSDEIACLVESVNFELQAWDDLYQSLETDFKLAVAQGGAIQKWKLKEVGMLAKRARTVVICGHQVPSVNASRLFASDLGSMLARGNPFAAVWSQSANGRFNYSLRSTDAGLDCGAIAERFGGGGHRNAAAFSSDKIID